MSPCWVVAVPRSLQPALTPCSDHLDRVALQRLAEAEDAKIRGLLMELVQLQSLRVTRKLKHVTELSDALVLQQQQLEASHAPSPWFQPRPLCQLNQGGWCSGLVHDCRC